MRRVLAGLAVPLVVTLVAVGVVAATRPPAPDPGPAAEPGARPAPVADLGDVTLTAALQPFDGCEELGDYYRRHALDLVGPFGLGGDVMAAGMFASGGEESAEGASADTAVAASAAPDPVGSSVTGTNVQEAGVDEPDLLKTNGSLAVAVARGRLQVLDVSGGRPEWLTAHDLPQAWSHELLLDGSRVLVLSRGDATAARSAAGPVPHSPTTTLTLVDLSAPTEPTEISSVTLDGEYRSARLDDGVARVVVHAPPTGLPFVAPDAGGLREEREATERNREIVRDSTAPEWLPWMVRRDGTGAVVEEGPLLECAQVRRPQDFSGLATLAVLSLDLGGQLSAGGGTGVVADGETVYASRDTLYVATSDVGPWMRTTRPAPAPGPVTTRIHAFDLSEPDAAPYLATGEVDGVLLNSYAMSEHDGVLRVATTEQPDWLADEPGASESQVVTLRRDGPDLVAVGSVGGLGVDERIYAVRFLGERGVVVTFRETDPLYVLDLSDPAQPSVEGELKITGYSAYLHPVGDDLLLGIGQEADDSGRTLGVQASLFDVADPAAPTRLDQIVYGEGYTEVEHDAHAFTYAPDASLAVVPAELYPQPSGQSEREFRDGLFAGALGVRVDGRSLVEAGRVSHVDQGRETRGGETVGGETGGGIRRSVVVGDVLYTLSERGLQANDLSSLEQLAFARFGG